MPRFAALLRGVNVGGAKRVPMAELRTLLESLGYRGVRTLLNSGNVVFVGTGRSTSAHQARIEAALAQSLHVEVPVIVKSAREFAAIARANPLADVATDPARLLVAFTGDAVALKSFAALSPLLRPPERLVFGEHALYLWCANGILASKAAALLLGKSGKAATTRNWATVQKISALLQQDAGWPETIA